MTDSRLSGWHRLSEHYVSAEPESEFLSIQHVTEAVKDLGLEPSQVERIREAILGAIKDTRCFANEPPDHLAVLIRLWVPNLEAADTSQAGLEDGPDHRKVSSGLGFFLIEKTLGEPGNPWKVFCRMVDVLIYGK